MRVERQITIVTNDPPDVAELYQEGLVDLGVPCETIVIDTFSAFKAVIEKKRQQKKTHKFGGIVDVSLPRGQELARSIANDEEYKNMRIIYVTTRSPEDLKDLVPTSDRILEKPFEDNLLMDSLDWISEESDDN